ncbi:gamma subclass chorismate mutase AroQ [Streptomyces sp. NPDC047002]|uniref:gamma subclass chorismate mutase AroQ n=1 Tax=Streptomyces sp. NPDC047002 TaxID=3155475 RepID=UPI003452419D
MVYSPPLFRGSGRRWVLGAVTGVAAGAVVAAGTAAAVSRGPAVPFGHLGPLAELAVRRIRLGDQVAAAKRSTGAPVGDPVREREELARVRRQAAGIGLDPEVAARFFEDQIEASKVVQRGLLERWRDHPDEVPAACQDLAAVRAELDALGQRLLYELAATERVRGAGPGCAVALSGARTAGVAVHRLDALHREALGIALRSVCGA